jgi:hypothetical protein
LYLDDGKSGPDSQGPGSLISLLSAFSHSQFFREPFGMNVADFPPGSFHSIDAVRRVGYSNTRVAVPRGNTLKWLFPQEKATFEVLIKGTFTLVLL